MTFIADAGPIISFARAGRLEFLRQVVGELWIPDAVFRELAVEGKPGSESMSLRLGRRRRVGTCHSWEAVGSSG